MSLLQRGKISPIRGVKKDQIQPRTIDLKTMEKFQLRTKGVIIKVYDLKENLIYEFPTISKAAKFYGVHLSTISKYVETGKLWDNKFIFKMELNSINSCKVIAKTAKPLAVGEIKQYSGNFVKVFDKENQLLYTFNSIRSAASYLELNRQTFVNYANSEKLWKNLYYFKTESEIRDTTVKIVENSIKGQYSQGLSVEVYNPEGILEFKSNSMRETAKILGISPHYVKKFAIEGKIWNNKIIKLIYDKN